MFRLPLEMGRLIHSRWCDVGLVGWGSEDLPRGDRSLLWGSFLRENRGVQWRSGLTNDGLASSF